MQKFENERCSGKFFLVKHDYALNEQKVISSLMGKAAIIEARQQIVFDFLREKNGDKHLKNQQMMEKFIVLKTVDKASLAPGYYVEVNPRKTFYKMTFCEKYTVDEEIPGRFYNSTVVKHVWQKMFNLDIVSCGYEHIKESFTKSKDFVRTEDLEFAQELTKMFNREIHKLPVFNEIRECLEQQRAICIAELIKKYTEYFQGYSKDCNREILQNLQARRSEKKMLKLPPMPNTVRHVVVKDNTVSIHQKLAQEALAVFHQRQCRAQLNTL